MPAIVSPQRALGLAVKARRNELGLTQETLATDDPPLRQRGRREMGDWDSEH